MKHKLLASWLHLHRNETLNVVERNIFVQIIHFTSIECSSKIFYITRIPEDKIIAYSHFTSLFTILNRNMYIYNSGFWLRKVLRSLAFTWYINLAFSLIHSVYKNWGVSILVDDIIYFSILYTSIFSLFKSLTFSIVEPNPNEKKISIIYIFFIKSHQKHTTLLMDGGSIIFLSNDRKLYIFTFG